VPLAFADNRRPDSLASRMRRRRLEWLNELLDARPEPVRILDVGGTAEFWRQNRDALTRRCELTLLNLAPADISGLPDAQALVGDGRRMPQFEDGGFDLVFSNSVIEHVGTLYDQMAMAAEVRRVGRGYFVQTPNRWFPLEPHYLMPLWQFWPLRLRAWLQRRRTLGWMRCQPDPLCARAEVEQVRLLDGWEMRRLFPDGERLAERVGPLVKSWVARRRPAGGGNGRHSPDA
jgi:hypothetical protein